MLAAEGLRQIVSESETRAESCPACALQAPTVPSAAGGGASAGSGVRVALQAVSHILMDVSLPTDICMMCPHKSNGSPAQELAFCLNCPGSKALRELCLSLPGM